NVAAMDAAQLRAAWPFGSLVDVRPEMMAVVPVPVARADALKGEATLTYARVAHGMTPSTLARAFQLAGERYPKTGRPDKPDAGALVAAYRQAGDRRAPARQLESLATAPRLDPAFTGSIGDVAGRARSAMRQWLAVGAQPAALATPAAALE